MRYLKLADYDEDRLNGNLVPEDRLPKQDHNPTPQAAVAASTGFRRHFMRIVRYIAGLVLLAVVSYNFFNSRYANGTLMDKARRDQVVLVENDDADMAAAFRKARETLPEFLALARAPRPTATKLAVKVAIPAGDGNEYFWLTPFAPRGDQYAGRVNNSPRSAKQVKFGQVVEFSEAEIVDWLYMEGGKMRGNFTACAMLKREPADQA